MPLGPGYVVEKQEIRVQFAPAAGAVHIEANYRLRNTGTRSLSEIIILLPGGRRLHHGPAEIKWDGTEIADAAHDGAREVRLRFAIPWVVSAEHALRISYDILPPPAENASALRFSQDAFYLPAAGWSPELPQLSGLFGFGGVPPKKWELVVTVPEGFMVHTSGALKKGKRDSAGMQTWQALQTVDDRYPFVVSGRYSSMELRNAQQNIFLWSRAPGTSAILRQASSALARTVDVYNASFGAPANRVKAFWIVECPIPKSCMARFHAGETVPPSGEEKSEDEGPGQREESGAELASSDTVMVDTTSGAPQLAADAAPSLAASWLGYGRNPGFYVQTAPLSELPNFAAEQAREAMDGAQMRSAAIRRALELVPKVAVAQSSDARGQREEQRALRAKSLLFFYALQDRSGAQAFHSAIVHMLDARAARGFDLDDLIAAFEQETHQNVAQFVRQWMKRPGVPQEFRARYEHQAANDAGAPTSTPAAWPKASPGALHFQGDLP